MPFTLSHAAAALPLRKFKPIWPALVIGTFAPDLRYFVWISDQDRSGHQFPEVLLYTLPLAVAVLWGFEWIVKSPAIELLPSVVQRRLQDKVEPLSFSGWRRLSSIVLWIAIGIATHLFWDEFTHSHTWITTRWSLFSYSIAVPFLHPMKVLKILQHGSTVAGMLVLAGWLAAWYRRTSSVPKPELREFSPFVKVGVVFTMIVIAVLAGYPLAMFKLASHELPISPLVMIATVFEAVTLVCCIELLIYGLMLTLAGRSRRLRRLNNVQFDEPGG